MSEYTLGEPMQTGGYECTVFEPEQTGNEFVSLSQRVETVPPLDPSALENIRHHMGYASLGAIVATAPDGRLTGYYSVSRGRQRNVHQAETERRLAEGRQEVAFGVASLLSFCKNPSEFLTLNKNS